ncbi:MAG: cation-efflux pump [Chloroflexi bacterium]|nr:cation-efflux pump [Chloroflexota bacterium]
MLSSVQHHDQPKAERAAGAGSSRAAKQSAALVSAIAVLILGIAKLALGILTGSLGLIADAVHSGLDLITSFLTYLAVRLADRPADADHPYGHGRVENLSGFIEALIILGTAIGIGYEAVRHILGGQEEVIPTAPSFGVLLASIAVAYWRSRVLHHLAVRYQSDALAADALNFRADVWSSLVVLGGLALVAAGRAFHLPALASYGDAAAALIVALLVIGAAGHLARRTIDALLDRSPTDLTPRLIDAVAGVPGVIACQRLRLRRVGGYYFVDVVAVADRTTTVEEMHRLVERIRQAIHAVEPQSDVIVQIEPAPLVGETILDRIHQAARELGVRVHDVQVHRVDDTSQVKLHVEVRPGLSLDAAHGLASKLEERIAAQNPDVSAVHTHLEIEPEVGEVRTEVTALEPELVHRIHALASSVIGSGRCHEVHIYRRTGQGRSLDVVLHCTFPASLNVTRAHEEAERLEQALREALPGLGSVLVHVEPPEGEMPLPAT